MSVDDYRPMMHIALVNINNKISAKDMFVSLAITVIATICAVYRFAQFTKSVNG